MDESAAPARPQVHPPQRPVAAAAGDAIARPRPAGFWLRFWAWLYDTAILAIVLTFLAFLVKVAFGVALVSFLVGLVERGMTGSFGALLAMAAVFLGWIVLALVLWLLEQLLGWLYYASCESGTARATPGKRLLALCVVDAQGRRISFGRATLRHFLKFAFAFPALVVFAFLLVKLADDAAGSATMAAWVFVATLAATPVLFVIFYGMAGWTRDRQALHDMLSGCYVVRSKDLTSGQVFALAIGSVALLLVVWIASSLAGVHRSTGTIEQREQRTTASESAETLAPTSARER